MSAAAQRQQNSTLLYKINPKSYCSSWQAMLISHLGLLFKASLGWPWGLQATWEAQPGTSRCRICSCSGSGGASPRSLVYPVTEQFPKSAAARTLTSCFSDFGHGLYWVYYKLLNNHNPLLVTFQTDLPRASNNTITIVLVDIETILMNNCQKTRDVLGIQQSFLAKIVVQSAKILEC